LSGGNIFYSGSPLPYSFSEEHDKLVRVINTEPDMSVSDIGVDVGIRVATITDSLEKLLSSTKYSYAEKCFVRAISTDESLQVGAIERLRQRFPNILEIEQNSMVQQRLMTTGDTRKRVQRNPIEIVDEYITETLDDGLSETAKKFVLDSVSQVVGSANS
jgi:exonuclease SbcD